MAAPAAAIVDRGLVLERDVEHPAGDEVRHELYEARGQGVLLHSQSSLTNRLLSIVYALKCSFSRSR